MENKKGFTLLELLIVISIIAILSVIVILVLNPSEMLKKARDSQRMADLNTIKTAIGLYLVGTNVPYLGLNGTSNTGCAPGSRNIWFSKSGVSGTVDTDATATSSASQSLAGKTNGTGWIPVNLSSLSGGAPISNWPVDPVNSVANLSSPATSDLVYRYSCNPASQFEVDATLESNAYTITADKRLADGGDSPSLYEVGTNLTVIGSLDTDQVALNLPFNSPGCYPSSSAMGTKNEPITIVRNTSSTYIDGAGNVQTCAADQLRVTPQGALIEPMATNLALYSEQFQQAWGKGGTATVTADAAQSPAGTMTADLVTYPAVADSVWQGINGSFSASTSYTFSIWLKGTAGQTVEVYLKRLDANPYEATVINPTFTGNWQRIIVPLTLANAHTVLGFAVDRAAGSTAGSVYVWGAQVETGTVATSYIPTTGTTAARSADMVSVANPLTSVQPFCVVASVSTPDNFAPPGFGSYRVLWGFGAWTTANTWAFYETGNTKTFYNLLTHESGQRFRVGVIATVGTERLGACYGGPDELGEYDSGALVGSMGGTSGVLGSMPNIIYLANGRELGGTISNFIVCKTGTYGQSGCQ